MKSVLFWIILCLFIIAESKLLANPIFALGGHINNIVFFASSLAIAMIAMLNGVLGITRNYPKSEIGESKPKTDWTTLLFGSSVMAALVLFAKQQFHVYPLELDLSDIYPQVLNAAKLFLQGEYPYQPVTLSNYQMNNTYLPMQWLPFCVSEFFGKDPRWMPILSWSFGIIALLYTLSIRFLQIKPNVITILTTLFSVSLAGWMIYNFIYHNALEYFITLELLPSFYYIWLCIGLLSGSVWISGLSLGACLLSRFSILFFVPFIVFYLIKTVGLRKATIAFGITAIFILLVFVLPFLTKDPQLLSKIIGNYENGALSEWKVQQWQEAGSEPHQLSRGVGLAIYFKKMFEPDILKGILWLKRIEISLCILSMLFTSLIYHKYAKTEHASNWILLGGMKLYFAFFYHFSLIPYPYLFLLPLTISVVLFLYSAKESNLFSYPFPKTRPG